MHQTAISKSISETTGKKRSENKRGKTTGIFFSNQNNVSSIALSWESRTRSAIFHRWRRRRKRCTRRFPATQRRFRDAAGISSRLRDAKVFYLCLEKDSNCGTAILLSARSEIVRGTVWTRNFRVSRDFCYVNSTDALNWVYLDMNFDSNPPEFANSYDTFFLFILRIGHKIRLDRNCNEIFLARQNFIIAAILLSEQMFYRRAEFFRRWFKISRIIIARKGIGKRRKGGKTRRRGNPFLALPAIMPRLDSEFWDNFAPVQRSE